MVVVIKVATFFLAKLYQNVQCALSVCTFTSMYVQKTVICYLQDTRYKIQNFI